MIRKSLLAAWFACVIFLSFIPEGFKQRLGTQGWLHFPLHFAVFLFSGFLAWGIAGSVGIRCVRCLAVIALGFSLEMLESRMFGNIIEWRDIAADTLGVLVAMLAGYFSRRQRVSD